MRAATPGNPYDGDTLADQHEQVSILSGVRPAHLLVDLGYRSREVDGARVLHRGKPKSLSQEDWKWLKRRSSVEPVIGHLKGEHRMRRCFLKGKLGYAQNAVWRRPATTCGGWCGGSSVFVPGFCVAG